jgi:hypothetical protein
VAEAQDFQILANASRRIFSEIARPGEVGNSEVRLLEDELGSPASIEFTWRNGVLGRCNLRVHLARDTDGSPAAVDVYAWEERVGRRALADEPRVRSESLDLMPLQALSTDASTFRDYVEQAYNSIAFPIARPGLWPRPVEEPPENAPTAPKSPAVPQPQQPEPDEAAGRRWTIEIGPHLAMADFDPT